MTNYFGEALRKAREKARSIARRHDVAYPSDASVEIRIGEEIQVHGACLRAQYYRITETTISDPESAERSFVAQVGEACHTAVAQVFGLAEQLVHEERRLWIPSVRLSGRVDVNFRPEPNGKVIGCEVKSIGGYNGRKGTIDQRRGSPLYPRLKDLCQVVVYAEELKDETDEWIILYIDRETGAWREHQIIYRGHDDILVNGQPSSVTPKAVHDRWNRLWAHVDAGTLPPRDYWLRYSPEHITRLAERGELTKDEKERYNAGRKVDKGDKECREWCQWRTQCWKTDKDN